MVININMLEHLSFWCDKTEDECIEMATHDGVLNAEEALLNIVEANFMKDFSKEIIKGLIHD